ncbi:zinc ABC transporter [gut metagenome]|uniref:Zinc ABC transporter n=1 Tax=gut metagenome TaxID=749906 RepID=J9FXP4_9ZZZZ
MPQILYYTFFQHAILGALLVSLLCAMVGTYVVNRRMVIAGGGVAHASLGGVGLGAFFGLSPLFCAAGFALLSGLGIHELSRRKVREDAAIAMLWTLGMSVGILAAYLTPGFMTELPLYLFGDILAITATDLWISGGLLLFTAAFFYLFLPAIITVSYDTDFAVTQGLPVAVIERVMIGLTALTIVACLHLVGVVMVVSLLSIPQMTAALFTNSFRKMIGWSALISFLECLGGLMLSYYCNVPSGATIILLAVMLYFVLRTIKTLFFR